MMLKRCHSEEDKDQDGRGASSAKSFSRRCDQVLFGRACDVGRGRGGKGKGSESFSHRDASKSYLESVSCEGGIYEGRGRDLGATRGLYECERERHRRLERPLCESVVCVKCGCVNGA